MVEGGLGLGSGLYLEVLVQRGPGQPIRMPCSLACARLLGLSSFLGLAHAGYRDPDNLFAPTIPVTTASFPVTHLSRILV